MINGDVQNAMLYSEIVKRQESCVSRPEKVGDTILKSIPRNKKKKIYLNSSQRSQKKISKKKMLEEKRNYEDEDDYFVEDLYYEDDYDLRKEYHSNKDYYECIREDLGQLEDRSIKKYEDIYREMRYREDDGDECTEDSDYEHISISDVGGSTMWSASSNFHEYFGYYDDYPTMSEMSSRNSDFDCSGDVVDSEDGCDHFYHNPDSDNDWNDPDFPGNFHYYHPGWSIPSIFDCGLDHFFY